MLPRNLTKIAAIAALAAALPIVAAASPSPRSNPVTLSEKTVGGISPGTLPEKAEPGDIVLEHTYDFEYDYGPGDTAVARAARTVFGSLDWTLLGFGFVLTATIFVVIKRLSGRADAFPVPMLLYPVAVSVALPFAVSVVAARAWPGARGEEMFVALLGASLRGS
jgi:hypothetical protein